MSNSLLKYSLLLLPALVYFGMVNYFALNIPSQDDYDAILKYLHYYNNVHGADKFWSLFQQHNEHRILLSRIVYVLYYSIFGEINFRSIIFIGNLQLLWTFILFVSFIRRLIPSDWFVPGLVSGLCFFSLNNWENAAFAMASVQNYGVMFLFVASLYCYTRSKRWWLIPAVLLQVVCTFSSGNGMVGSAFIVLYGVLSRERTKMIVSGLAFLVFTPLYFIDYTRPVTAQPSANFLDVVQYFFHFAGAHILNKTEVVLTIGSVLLGAAILGLLAMALRKKRLYTDQNAVTFVCIAGFLLVSMLMTSVFRSMFGMYTPNRYLVYANMLFATMCVLLLYTANNPKKFYKPFIGLSLAVFALNTYTGIKGFSKLQATLKSTEFYYPDIERAKQAANEACQSHIYCIEKHR